MIKGNRIIFGYGTISCGCGYNAVIYTEIKPPQEIGEDIINDVEYGESIKITANLEEFNLLLKEINNIESNKEISFKGYILDFNNYNPKSVDAVIKLINRAKMYDLLAYAC